MNSKIIPFNSKYGVHLIPILVVVRSKKCCKRFIAVIAEKFDSGCYNGKYLTKVSSDDPPKFVDKGGEECEIPGEDILRELPTPKSGQGQR